MDVAFEDLSVAEAFARHCGGPLSGNASDHDMAKFAGVDQVQGPERAQAVAELGWDDLFFKAFLDKIEPHLGSGRPTFVSNWPARMAALARKLPSDPQWADRFELYAGGLELANAYGELVDPAEQRARFVSESQQRSAAGKTVYPTDEKLLEALAALPPTSGIALGWTA